MRGSTIVVATDLSVGAGAAARWAVAIGRLTGLPVVAVHVVEIDTNDLPSGRYDLMVHPERLGAARNEVSDWFIDHTDERPSGVEVRLGLFEAVIAQVVEESAAGLLVMSRTGRNALSHALIGSRVQRLVAQPPCPVAVVNPVEDGVERGLDFKILAATDFSPAAGEAVAFAGSLAQMTGGHLDVVHSVHVPVIRVGSIELSSPERVADEEEKVEAAMEGLVVERLPGLSGATCRALSGPPARAIVDYVRDVGHDVLVLGRTGHTTRLGDVFGSVPRRLVRALPCTVIVT